MKKVKLLVGLVLISLILSSCASNYVCPAYATKDVKNINYERN
jgi:PBP1b-binding outer membrane lipoprotein LpoB